MKKSFIITRAAVEAADAAALLNEIIEGTGSEVEAASVLRSVQRVGTHPSLEFYEVSQVPGRRTNGAPGVNAWRVRADFGVREADAPEA